MGTKKNPGTYDCYANAEPDEPMFVLLGRDPDAPILVRLWAALRARAGESPAKVQEALDCAGDMERFGVQRGNRPRCTHAKGHLVEDRSICDLCGFDVTDELG